MKKFGELFTVAIILVQMQGTPALAEAKSDDFGPGEPAWTLKIPKGRYPCLCDTPPHLWRNVNRSSIQVSDLAPEYEMSTDQFQAHIERIIFSRLRLLIEHKFDRAGLLSCEVRYKLTKDNTIKDVEVLVTSKNSDFDTSVLKALESLRFGFVGYPHKQGKSFVEFQSVVTPDGVYPGFSGKIYQPRAPRVIDQADKIFE